MKIDGPEGIHPLPNSENNTQGPQKPGEGFEDIFQKALNPETARTVSPATTSFVRPVVPIMEHDLPADDNAGVVKSVENLLDLLEDYRQLLMRPGGHLKDLDALALKLDGEQKRLAPVMDKLPDGDALKTILNQSLVTTSVEIFKYQRGDYLA